MKCSEYRCGRESLHQYLYSMPHRSETKVYMAWCALHAPNHRWLSHDHRLYECQGCGLQMEQLNEKVPLPKGPCFEKGVK